VPVTIPGPGPSHRIDYVSVVAIAAGQGTLTTQRRNEPAQIHPLRPGAVAFTGPDTTMRWSTRNARGIQTWAVSFSDDDWQHFASIVGAPRAADAPTVVHIQDAIDPLLETFRQICSNAIMKRDVLDLIRFWSWLVPTLFPRSEYHTARASTPSWLTDAIHALRDELNLRRGLAALQDLSHVSGSHLAAVTRTHFGKTPSALVLEIRLEHAAALLRSTDATVLEIARRCGFINLSHFSSAFRSQFDASPREYRRIR
jgi:AraC-like DNA-binding protein